MAHEAVAAGHSVWVSVNQWQQKPAEVERLERAGVEVHTRSRLRQRVYYRSSPPLPLPVNLRGLDRFAPDVVCLSHGATWDVPRDPGLHAVGPSPRVRQGRAVRAAEPVRHRVRTAHRRRPSPGARLLRVGGGGRVGGDREPCRGRAHARVDDRPQLRRPEPADRRARDRGLARGRHRGARMRCPAQREGQGPGPAARGARGRPLAGARLAADLLRRGRARRLAAFAGSPLRVGRSCRVGRPRRRRRRALAAAPRARAPVPRRGHVAGHARGHGRGATVRGHRRRWGERLGDTRRDRVPGARGDRRVDRSGARGAVERPRRRGRRWGAGPRGARAVDATRTPPPPCSVTSNGRPPRGPRRRRAESRTRACRTITAWRTGTCEGRSRSNPIWYHTIDLGQGVETPGGSTSGRSSTACRGPTYEASAVWTSAPTTASWPSSSSDVARRRSSRPTYRTTPHGTGCPRAPADGSEYLESQAGTEGPRLRDRRPGARIERRAGRSSTCTTSIRPTRHVRRRRVRQPAPAPPRPAPGACRDPRHVLGRVPLPRDRRPRASRQSFALDPSSDSRGARAAG